MTFKEYIDKCTWDKLKATPGVRDFMQRSLADLQSIEPKHTDKTSIHSIHFSENQPDEDCSGDKVFAKYHASLYDEEEKQHYGMLDQDWEKVLPLEVKIGDNQKISDNEIVVSVIWELTWLGATNEDCRKACRHISLDTLK